MIRDDATTPTTCQLDSTVHTPVRQSQSSGYVGAAAEAGSTGWICRRNSNKPPISSGLSWSRLWKMSHKMGLRCGGRACPDSIEPRIRWREPCRQRWLQIERRYRLPGVQLSIHLIPGKRDGLPSAMCPPLFASAGTLASEAIAPPTDCTIRATTS